MARVDPKVKERALRLLQQGKGPQEVADAVKVPRTTIATWKSALAQSKPKVPTPPPAAEDEGESSVVTLRFTASERALRLHQRIRALVQSTGLHEALVLRKAVALGVAEIERDPGVLVRAVAPAAA